MTRLIAVAVALAVAGCGGGSTDSGPTYAYAYELSCISCGSPQVGHCIDGVEAPGQPAASFTCTESRNGLGVESRGWTYSESPCPRPDCRQVSVSADCKRQVECVERF